MNPITFYLKSVHEKSHGYRPTWLPNMPIELGDYGVIEDNVFRKDGNISDLGISFKEGTSENESSMDLSSEKGVAITSKIAGKIEPKAVNMGKADAGFIVEFNNEKSFVFKINGFVLRIISNLGDVKKEILNRFRNANWEPGVVVISEIIEAKSATILLSGQAGSKVELKASGNVDVVKLDIADASAKFQVASSQSMAAKIVGEKVNPLYRAIGIKKNLFSANVAGKSLSDSDIKEEEFSMEEIPIEVTTDEDALN